MNNLPHAYLQKLEWPQLCQNLAQFAHSQDAMNRLLTLTPSLEAHDIEDNLRQLDELKQLSERGYKVPVHSIEPIQDITLSLKVGRSLYPEQLLSLLSLLRAIKGLKKFATDFEEKSSALRRFNSTTYALPKIQSAIEKAIGPDAQVLDSASNKLKKIRQSKMSLRKHIEETIRKLIQRHEIQKYLQDDFFSIRNERYTIPMTLDGHGRIDGVVHDTSDSGQSLFIEPKEIQGLNEELIHVFLEEKIEVGRILKELSTEIAADFEILEYNYKATIELEILWAKCQYGMQIQGHKIHLGPTTHLIQAAHPLLNVDHVTRNDIELKTKALIISGPNAGGKTVVLKTLGLLSLMTKAGLLIPCHPDSSIQVFNSVFVDLGDSQSLSSSLSTFSGHIFHIKKILENITESDLILIDEICVGTAPEAGAALAQAIIEQCVHSGAFCVVTTHFERLKKLAFEATIYRNASMEFKDYRPTYRLIYDIPGKSYGLEVARNHGLSESIIERAQSLLGSQETRVEDLIDRLQQTEAQLKIQSLELDDKNHKLEELELKYTQEKELLSEQRQKVQKQLKDTLEEERQQLRAQYQNLMVELKDKIAQSGSLTVAEYAKTKSDFDEKFQTQSTSSIHPPDPISSEVYKVGMQVLVKSLGTQGEIVSIQDQKVTVKTGIMQVETFIQDLESRNTPSKKRPFNPTPKTQKPSEDKPISFVIPTSKNSLNLCGTRADEVQDKLFQFLDSKYRSDESILVIIHGHGVVKEIVRKALKANCPYPLKFRSGEEKEGLDAVTIVHFGRS